MIIVYGTSVAMAFFAGVLPMGVFSVIWEQISENLTVGIPYIAILRLLLSLGAVLAVIFAHRFRTRPGALDLVIGSIALEAICLFCFSLARVFWHLALWTVLLGFGIGMSLTLLCLRLAWSAPWRMTLLFAAEAAGVFFGTGVLIRVLQQWKSWRSACQVLAIAEIFICFVLFVIRKVVLKGMWKALREERARERARARAVRSGRYAGKELTQQVRDAFVVRLVCAYMAAGMCALIVLAAALWPAGFLATDEAWEGISAAGVLWVSAGLCAGRLLFGALKIKRNTAWALGMIAAAAVLVTGAVILERGGGGETLMYAVSFVCGAGEGAVLPNLILIDDVRLDADAVASMTELVPAFFFGGWAVITPLTQTLFGAGAARHFALWMLIFLSVQAVLLMFAVRGEED